MKYLVLTGAAADPQLGPVNLVHDFGRPVNLICIRLTGFSYPFNASDTHIGGFAFTLNGTTLNDEDQLRTTINMGGEVTRFTWGCSSVILTGQKGVFQHDFSAVESETRIVPRTPVFTNSLTITVDYKTFETGKANTWPTREAGWEFSVTLEYVEE